MTEEQPDQLSEAVAADIAEVGVPAPPVGLTERTVEAMLAGGAARVNERGVAGRPRRLWPLAAALARGWWSAGPPGWRLRS